MRATDLQFRAAIRGHAGRVERFRRGELSPDEFRPMRLSYGLYYQLDHTSHMQRIKLPGGLLTAAQADCMADIADRFGRGVVHVTTRQDVQLHWVPLENVIEIYENLHAVGITTRGACADSVRNVTGCVHGGVWPGEPFDVTPYVLAVHEYFLFNPLNTTLPRKFKIGFAGCADDCAQGVVNDIGYYAGMEGNRPGFKVFAGGGLGAQPFLAKPVCDFIPADDVLVMSEAIVRIHHRHGDRKNRARARLKYVMKRWGEDRFRREILAEFERVGAERGAALRAELREMVAGFAQPGPHRPPAPAAPCPEPMAHWVRTNAFAQKQAGYHGVTVQITLGDVTSPQLRELAAVSRELGNGVMRTTNEQNIMIPWISGADLGACYERLQAIGLAHADALRISDVVSCPGADFCSLAVSRSMGIASDIRSHLLRANGRIERLGVFRVRISGCPNSCGQHHVADIGLTGMLVKDAAGVVRPHYSLLLGGGVGFAGGALGQRLPGKFSAADVPKVVEALADHFLENRKPVETFAQFVERVGMPSLTAASRQGGVTPR